MISDVDGLIGYLAGRGGTHTLYGKRFSILAGESFLDYEPLVGENWLDKKERIPGTGPFECKCGDKHLDGDPLVGTLLGDPEKEPAARFTQLRMEHRKKRGATMSQNVGLQRDYEQVVAEFAT